jgi:hypothetical protein
LNAERDVTGRQDDNVATDALLGFTVAGYLGDKPTAESAKVIAVLATDEMQALVEARQTYPGFTPVGVMSEAEHERHLQMIRELRAQQSR